MKVFGIAGFKNAGKTTLVVDLLRTFRTRGLRVATIKHAHHAFDIDHPGKDSYQHREAGAEQVVISSSRRWAQIVEMPEDAEPTLADLLTRIDGVDLVLVEGYKAEQHPRLELRRRGRQAPELAGTDPGILAIVADFPVEDAPVPVIARDDLDAIADFVLAHAVSSTALD